MRRSITKARKTQTRRMQAGAPHQIVIVAIADELTAFV